MPSMRRHTQRGFTMLNLLVTIAILALISGIAVVTLAPDDRARVMGAASVLAADLEHAQAMSLVTPEDPILVRIDEAGEGYWLERRSTPDVAIPRTNGEPYVVIFGEGDAATLQGVDLSIVAGADAAAVEFDAFGRLADLDDVILIFELNGEQAWLAVSSSTGFVSIENTQPVLPPVKGS